MQKNYSWDQAKNMLLTGIAKRVRYQVIEGCSFFATDGVICRVYANVINENREPDDKKKAFILEE